MGDHSTRSDKSLKRITDSRLNRTLKISIIVGVLMIVLSFVYYLVIFLPQKEQDRVEASKKEDIENKKNDCAKLGMQKYEEEKATQEHQEHSDLGSVGHYNVPQYKFNEKLNTCIYANTYRSYKSRYLGKDVAIKYINRYIVDLYTNENIINFRTVEDDVVDISEKEYEAKLKELFKEDH